MSSFVHLNVHSHYSILDGMSKVPDLVDKCISNGMYVMALTDLGGMFGIKKLLNYSARRNEKVEEEISEIDMRLQSKELTEETRTALLRQKEKAQKRLFKPIVGVEVYCARRSHTQKETLEDRGGWHLVLLAKNKTGYRNLCKLVSASWVDGYYTEPRIDKCLLKQYHEGLIVLSGGLESEIAQEIMSGNVQATKETIMWFKSLFGDDYYLEVQRHKTDKAEGAMRYETQQKVNEIVLQLAKDTGTKAVATNNVHFTEKKHGETHDRFICLHSDTSLDNPTRKRYTKQEWLKTPYEMKELFADHPELLANTLEIAEKVETYSIDSPPIIPKFDLPAGFGTEEEYLEKLVWDGAANRYQELTDGIRNRIAFELHTIKTMSYPGYFLLVWDFVCAARKMGVLVGPGRGSVAGSVVAYCLGITEVDPLKYNLLFERFLNPSRVSLPDIDLDFDDDGRDKLFSWLTKKYGKERVAHIVTDDAEILKRALRSSGIHACSLTIGADDLSDLVPLCTMRRWNGENFLVTQYEGWDIESTGLVKFDFLGLRSISCIKKTIANIRETHGEDLDINSIPLDDAKTYELFCSGDTSGVFQFKSPEIQEYLKKFRPSNFEDLVAFNSLYRYGAMEWIPSFIARKDGQAPIEYELPEMKKYLESTYGLMVYQEQLMLLSQQLADFTPAESEKLRKAMGKKVVKTLNILRHEFIKRGIDKGYDVQSLEKTWNNWYEVSPYLFNKSHAICYTLISYRMAYLKVHYPVEFEII